MSAQKMREVVRQVQGLGALEAMAVLPDTRVVLVSKQTDGQPGVYRLPLRAGAVGVAERGVALVVQRPGDGGGGRRRIR